MIRALIVEDDPEFAQQLGYRLDEVGMVVSFCIASQTHLRKL